MDVKRIGDAAGLVWQKLRESDNGCTITELKKIDGFTGDEVVAGLGWLAREGKIHLESRGKKTTVSLIEAELFA